jgi:AhpD family alkylhydroperoxidase
MMVDWNGYRQQLVETIGNIARLSPETVKGYNTLSAAGTKTNHLDAKTRELIALAVAVSLRCDGCITVHTEAAIKHGASREEIAEALGVAVSVNAGACARVLRSRDGRLRSQPGVSRSGIELTTNRSRRRQTDTAVSNERLRSTAVVADSHKYNALEFCFGGNR